MFKAALLSFMLASAGTPAHAPDPLIVVPSVPSTLSTPSASASESIPSAPVATSSAWVATGSASIASNSVEQLLMAPEVVIPRPKTLTILHTNDTYGLFDPVKLDPYSSRPMVVGGVARTAEMISAERARKTPLLVLCAGNVLGPNPLSAASRGAAMIQAMNRLGYDAWLPSNYDFTYGLDALRDRIRESSASVVLTNVRDARTKEPFAKPFAVFVRNGLRVAVLGLLDPSAMRYVDFADQGRLVIDPPLEAAEHWVPLIQKEASPDVVVALTHLSLDEEMPLLARDSGIDLVIGGFNSSNAHSLSVHAVVGIDGKQALHAGGFGTAIGKARLTFEPGPQGNYHLDRIEPDLVRLDEDTLPLKQAEASASTIMALMRQSVREADEHWKQENGDVAAIASGLDSEAAMGLVPEIMRLTAHAELGILPRGFFHSVRVFGPITSVRSLFYAMPWEDALSVEQVPGGKLLALYVQATAAKRDAALFAGIYRQNGMVMVNGRALDAKSYYTVATTLPSAQGKIAGLEPLKSPNARALSLSVRRAVIHYFHDQASRHLAVSPQGFPDYYQTPFWKSRLQFTDDLQNRAVDTDGNTYPDLAWKTDKSGTNWGGDLSYQLGTAWGPNDLQNTLNLSYHSQQLANGPSQTSSDNIQLISDYRTEAVSALVRPYATLTMTTHFVQDPTAPPYFLGQLGTGVSHEFQYGLQLREGVEYRHHLYDPTQPDRTGGTFELLFNHTYGWLSVSTDLKLFATPKLASDGLLIDDESIVSLPLSDVTALTYKADLYRNTNDPAWATRHLIGLTFKFDQPWLF